MCLVQKDQENVPFLTGKFSMFLFHFSTTRRQNLNAKFKNGKPEKKTAGVLVHMSFLKGQANADLLQKKIKLFKFHRN